MEQRKRETVSWRDYIALNTNKREDIVKKRLLGITLTLTIILICLPAHAEEDFFDKYDVYIAGSFFTDHAKVSEGVNENNMALGISVDKWVGLTFENSHWKRSWFLGRTLCTKKWEPFDNDFFVRGNLHIGILYGYEDDMPDIAGWTIGAGPTAEIGYKRLSFEAFVVPFDGGVVVGLIKFKF